MLRVAQRALIRRKHIAGLLVASSIACAEGNPPLVATGEGGLEAGGSDTGESADGEAGAESGDEGGDSSRCEDPGPSYADPLPHVARAEGDPFIEILDLVHRDELVYSCTGTQGLTIWDSADPQAPVLLAENIGPSGLANASFPRCQHIALDPPGAEGPLRGVVTSRGDELQVTPFLALFDLSDPQNALELGRWSGPHSIEGVVLWGERVVAAAHSSGLLVFEHQGGESLELVGSYEDPDSDPWQPIWIDATHLAVAEGQRGLSIYRLDEAEGLDPQWVAGLELGGAAKHLDFDPDQGQLAVVTSQALALVDLSNPELPLLMAEQATRGTSLAVARGAGDLWYTAEWDEIRAYSWSEGNEDSESPGILREVASKTIPKDGPSAFTRVLAVAADPARDLVFAGEWEGMHTLRQEALEPHPELWLRPPNLDFGAVELNTVKDRVVVVENVGDAPLRVSDHDSHDDRVSISRPACLDIEPGSAAAFEVAFDTHQEGDIPDPLDNWIYLATNDPDEPTVELRVTGNSPWVEVGDPVPEFSLFDLEGVHWTHEDLQGQVTLLAYFATF